MRNPTAISYAVLVVIIVAIITGCSKSDNSEKADLQAQHKTTLNNTDNTINAEFLPEINRMDYTEDITAGNVRENMLMIEKTDFKIDGLDARLELYIDSETVISAGKEELTLDDGQLWSLIIRQGDGVYPLIHKQYIQMGQIDYWVYDSASSKELIVYAAVQESAGLSIKEFAYVPDKEPYFTKKDIILSNSGNLAFADKSGFDIAVNNP